jgi:membrane-bound lytic murein transglycosylase F
MQSQRVLVTYLGAALLLLACQVCGEEAPTPFARLLQKQGGTASETPSTADWEAIKKRGVLRMITRNNPFCCYIHHGRVLGFEYELVEKFAAAHHLKVAIVVPPNWMDLEEWLRQGKGDLVAANVTRTKKREQALTDLLFTRSYGGATQVAVGRLDEAARNITALKERRIFVREGTSYYDTLLGLLAEGASFELVPAPNSISELEKLERVADGRYDLTVCEDTMVLLAMEGGCRVKPLFPVSRKESWSWLIRRQNPALAEAINAFWEREHKSAFYNQRVNRYFTSETFAQTIVPAFLDRDKRCISKYDELFQKYGSLYGFDWLFLAAQAYQESRFDPSARSHCGAKGLMQLMPETAREMGFRDVVTPDPGIHAGVKYLSKLYNGVDGQVVQTDKLCFALASYNAGSGHVADARQITRLQGLDPNRWHGHVETGLKLLSRPEYAAQVQYGYCRAAETIHYVEQILLHYGHYKNVFESAPQVPPPPH